TVHAPPLSSVLKSRHTQPSVSVLLIPTRSSLRTLDSRMSLRRLPLVLVLAVTALSCSILPPDLAHELLPAQTQYTTASAAFQIIIDKHVDKPTSKQLIPGALDGVTKYLQSANIDANPVVDRP